MASSLTPPDNASAPAFHRAPRLPPGPPGLIQVNSAHWLQHDALAFLQSLARDYGDVVRFRFYLYPIYFINHPDALKRVLQDNHRNYNKDVIDYRLLRRLGGNGLIVNDGASWLRQRRLMQPALHRQRIAPFGTLITTATRAMIVSWRHQAKDRAALDVAEEMLHP